METPKLNEPKLIQVEPGVFQLGPVDRDQSQFFDEKGKFNDRKMMETPSEWLLGTHLPVKRYSTDKPHEAPRHGTMLPGDQCNIYSMNAASVIATYKNLDEILADGWIVD